MAISKGAKIRGEPPEIGVVSAYDHQSMIWLALSHSLARKLCIVLYPASTFDVISIGQGRRDATTIFFTLRFSNATHELTSDVAMVISCA